MTGLALQYLVHRTGSLSATPVGFRGKEACNLKPYEHSGEKNGETFTTFRMDSRTWAGAMHDEILEELDTAEANEGRVAEAEIRNGGVASRRGRCHQSDGPNDCASFSLRARKGDSKTDVCNPERSGFKARKRLVSQFGPRTGADRSVAYSRVTHPVSMSWAHINKLGDAAKREIAPCRHRDKN